MVRYIRYILFGLVLVLVAMASALTAMRFAIHGGEVNVPRLLGLIPSAAETTANDNGLVLVVDNHFYSDTVPEGHLVSQQPVAGTVVRRGWRIHVAVSLGPRKVEVPNVLGESRRAAEINLQRRGLEVASVAIWDAADSAPGQVLAQSPPPFSSNVTTPQVHLLMTSEHAQETYVMPSFIGRHYADVSEQIENAGFQLGKITEAAATPVAGSPLPAPGIILRQAPAPGARIIAGATISFEITR